jgi:hypothetical protein
MDASGTKQKLLPKLLKWLGATAVGLLLICSIVFYLVRIRASHAPTAIIVSACGDLGPGVRRIRADFGTQFDISETAFLVKSGVQDMPLGVNYSVILKDSTARLVITSNDTWKEVEDAFPVFSEDLHERNIRGANGRSVGMDRWGSLKSGERWRFVKFFNRDAVAYLPTAPKEAILLDQVISSACLSRDAHREK